MNIEQIAQIVDAQMYEEGRFSAATAYPEEFLRRCLSKLAEQAGGEPVGWLCDGELHEVQQYRLFTGDGPIPGQEKLYTETQYIAAQQRTAEACATVCEAVRAEDGDGQHLAWYAGFHMCIDAIRNGEWREYL